MTTDFLATRAMFDLPPGVIYLDGNSLGPLTKTAGARMQQVMRDEWGQMLITAWNRANWVNLADRLGDRIGGLIGAVPGSVVVGDTLSVKMHQALDAALQLRPERRVVLTDNGNFPSDLYVAERLLASREGYALRIRGPHEIIENLGSDVAVLMLTEVDYRTGRRHDMQAITRAAHDAGAVVVWDLAHSAGAVAVDLAGCNADFACGCTYKYLNGGPGSPAFLYAAPHVADQVQPGLAGWFGHANPFAFELPFEPAPGASRFKVGTPPVLQLAALECALDVWDSVEMADVQAQSRRLSEAFRHAMKTSRPDLELASPEDPAERGSQLSFRHPQGYAVVQALIDRNVIGDFRAPDIIRFGFCPLYNSLEDISQAARVLTDILANELWDRPAYKKRAQVT